MIDELVARLGREIVLTGEATLPYCRDWHGDVQSEAVAVLRPSTTGQVQECVRAVRDLRLQIVPQGGNTGLVLGALPDPTGRQVVLSLERMTAIRRFLPEDFAIEVEAGAILSDIKDAAAAEGLFFPLTLGAQGSCRIGGNVSTNAGGVNVLRYGMMRELVLGLEVVLPDGSLLEGLSLLRKDNRGIDLKQLFIGAEGTLGIITAVSLKLLPAPKHVATALVALPGLAEAITLYRQARRDCCDLMSAFEFMPPIAFTLAREAMPALKLPMATKHPAYALIEISGSGLVDVGVLMEQFLAGAFESGIATDGVVAQSQAQAESLWAIREGMNLGQAARGRHLRTDISVPLSQLGDFVRDAEHAIENALPGAVCVSYGHVGDGNVHLNVLPDQTGDIDAQLTKAKATIDSVLDRFGGSFSAEHGIGRLKREAFEAYVPKAQRRLLMAIRQAIDPDGIMNPGCQVVPDRVQDYGRQPQAPAASV